MNRINSVIPYSGINKSVSYDHKTSFNNISVFFQVILYSDNNRVIPALTICEYSGYFHMYPYIVKNHDIFTYGNCEISGNLHKSESGYLVEFHTLTECFLRSAFCDRKNAFCDHTSDHRNYPSAALLLFCYPEKRTQKKYQNSVIITCILFHTLV